MDCALKGLTNWHLTLVPRDKAYSESQSQIQGPIHHMKMRPSKTQCTMVRGIIPNTLSHLVWNIKSKFVHDLHKFG